MLTGSMFGQTVLFLLHKNGIRFVGIQALGGIAVFSLMGLSVPMWDKDVQNCQTGI